jgi:adenylosuccinate synthase
MEKIRSNVRAIIDGEAGSCGKGKVIAEIAIFENPEAAVANNMPNAGHTGVLGGEKHVFRTVPVSAVNKNTQLFIGPGSAIDMNVLEEEYAANREFLDGRKIIVHPEVPIIAPRHIEYEKKHLRSGSTFKGCGAVAAEKVMRSPDLKFFKEYKNIKATSRYYEVLNDYLRNSKLVVLEGSQGADLDLNHSGHYPYVTSRQISVAQMLGDSAISPKYLLETTMVIRPFPIRISNDTDMGKIYSGDYGESNEYNWDEMNCAAADGAYPIKGCDREHGYEYEKDFSEKTTVTKRERRIFDLDIEKLKHNVAINTPDNIYLNFFQHLDASYEGLKGDYSEFYIAKPHREFLNWIESETGVPITKLGTGAENGEFIIKNEF